MCWMSDAQVRSIVSHMKCAGASCPIYKSVEVCCLSMTACVSAGYMMHRYVVARWTYQDPYLSPYQEFQRWEAAP